MEQSAVPCSPNMADGEMGNCAYTGSSGIRGATARLYPVADYAGDGIHRSRRLCYQ